jgi:isopentenyl-diphosphate delta-isomerase
MAKPIVIVDINDKVLGLKEKYAAHKIPVPLHRAISIVIFSKDGNRMLITKRAGTKPTWGSFWTNAVCTHPFPKESYEKCAKRRLTEEIGLKTPLKDTLNFIYEAKMSSGEWGEHELDHTFIGYYDGPIVPNPEEVDGYEWIELKELKKDIKTNPNKYTPWFKIILKRL